MSEKTKVEIDRSRWRTGSYGRNQTGNGETSLLNDEGYFCCLGFVARAAGVPDADMLLSGEPSDLRREIDGLALMAEEDGEVGCVNSRLADKAIAINDQIETTPVEKEAAIAELFNDSPYELEFYGEFERVRTKS